MKNFESFSRSSQKIILEWISNAKQVATRQKRIAETVSLAAQNIKANHYRQ
ncbi:YdeI/OmpD-associated family protein [Mucilaginibacter gotjawali]|nr:YdeI/OmpD-associated family protein [Mucilaginibacter gotjawali]